MRRVGTMGAMLAAAFAVTWASASDTLQPPEEAEHYAVVYPVHVSFYIPDEHQTDEKFERVQRSLHEVEGTLLHILDADLFRISIKLESDQLRCRDEAAYAICVEDQIGANVNGVWTGMAGTRPLDIPRFKISISKRLFDDVIENGLRREEEFRAQFQHEIDSLGESLDRIDKDRTLAEYDVKIKSPLVDALRAERRKIRWMVREGIREADEASEDLDLLRERIATAEEELATAERTESDLKDEWFELFRMRDRLKAKADLHWNAFEKVLAHELLHAAGFQHDLDARTVLARYLCDDCQDDELLQNADQMREDFKFLQRILYHDPDKERAYEWKAKASHICSHTATSLRADWIRSRERGCQFGVIRDDGVDLGDLSDLERAILQSFMPLSR